MAWKYLLSPTFQVVNTAGKPATGGYIEVYIHGTRDRYYCASDFDGTLHPFKIPLDSLGANIVLADDSKTYDVYVYNRYGSLIMSRYDVPTVRGKDSAYSGDVSDATCSFTKDEGDTSEISSGSTLNVLFTKISKFFAGLKRVAFTGSYNDLSGKPSIPAAQVNSDWNANSGVAQILNKPDLSQYIPFTQKGATNGVGTLGANSLQPFEETYNGYFVENNGGSAKVVKIGRFKGSNELRDAGGASFSIVFRSTNQASGQALLWVQKGEFNKTDSVCRKVVIFNRPNSGGTGDTGTSIQFYKDDVTVDGVNYVDVYMSMHVYSTARITPLWMNRDMAHLTFSSESVELPQTAVIIDDSWFVRAPGAGAGDVSTPVFIAPNGVATPCTFVPVISHGFKRTSKNVVSGEENHVILSPAIELPTKRANWAVAIITANLSVDPNGTSLAGVSDKAKIDIDINGSSINTWVPVFEDGYFRKSPKTTFQIKFSPSLYPSTVTASVYLLNAPVGSIVECNFHITLLSSNTNF